MTDEVIGTYIPGKDGAGHIIRRDWSGQGWIYKNPAAFYHMPSEVCYIPELSDCIYTADDFIKLSLGQRELAEEMFLSVGWEHPETWLDEQFRMGELAVCPACGSIFQCYIGLTCPYCQDIKNKNNTNEVN